jgi:hypothetical protein
MQTLKDHYAEYLVRYRGRIDVRLAAAGLEPVGQNWLRAALVEMPGPLSREEFDEVLFAAFNETTLPLAENYMAYRRSQQANAKKDRKKLDADGTSIRRIIERLSKSPEHAEEGAAYLWNHFYSALDELGLAPKEFPDANDPRKSRIEYTVELSSYSKSFGSFANDVSEVRSAEKSR